MICWSVAWQEWERENIFKNQNVRKTCQNPTVTFEESKSHIFKNSLVCVAIQTELKERCLPEASLGASLNEWAGMAYNYLVVPWCVNSPSKAEREEARGAKEPPTLHHCLQLISLLSEENGLLGVSSAHTPEWEVKEKTNKCINCLNLSVALKYTYLKITGFLKKNSSTLKVHQKENGYMFMIYPSPQIL